MITPAQEPDTEVENRTSNEGLARTLSGYASPGIQYAVFEPAHDKRLFCAGMSDAAAHRNVSAETIFLSASTTKIITAILVLQLVQGNLLGLDDALSDYVPYSPYPSQITLRMLLNHSSGIANPNPMTWVHRLDEQGWPGEEKMLDAILARYRHVNFAPGLRYQYSNIGYWLLGRVLDRVTHLSYAELVRTQIVAKLDLREDELSCNPRIDDNLARGHLNRFGFIYPLSRLMMKAEIWDRPAGRWARTVPLTMDGVAYGGVFATAKGYLAILSDLLSQEPRLISTPMRKELFTPQTARSGDPLGVTLGFRAGEHLGRRYFSKPGGGPGFCSNVRIYPHESKATVFLRNTLAFSEQAIEAITDDLDQWVL